MENKMEIQLKKKMPASRKDERNLQERKRRAKMRDTLEEIKLLIPSLANEEKAPKALIYQKAYDYIVYLKNQNKGMKEKIDELEKKLGEIEEPSFNRAPTSIFQLVDFENLQQMIYSNEGWQEVASGDGKFGFGPFVSTLAELPSTLTVFRKIVDGSGIYCVKGLCTISASIDALITILLDLKGRMKWDRSLLTVQSIGNSGPGVDEVFYIAVKSPKGIANRDYVKARRFLRLDNGTFMVLERSLIHPAFPIRKDFIRGQVLFSGFLIHPIPNEPEKCLVGSISQLDLKGSIPLSILNYMTIHAPFIWYEAFIRQALECSHNLVHCMKTAMLRIATI